MTAWVYTADQVTSGQLVLKDEVLKPAYAGMTDVAIAAAINAQTEPDDGPIDMSVVRRQAIEARFTPSGRSVSRGVWGTLRSMANNRQWLEGTATTDYQRNDVLCAAANFLALFSELENGAALVRGNTLWNSMDADLTILVGTTGGGPLMTSAQANFMRALGDRTRQKWQGGVFETDVTAMRNAVG